MWSQNAYNKQILETISYNATSTYYDVLSEVFAANQANNIPFVQKTIAEFVLFLFFDNNKNIY